MDDVTHKYIWGNNPVRAKLKGRLCRIIAHGAKGSIIVEFENGQREYISRWAVRKLSTRQKPKEER